MADFFFQCVSPKETRKLQKNGFLDKVQNRGTHCFWSSRLLIGLFVLFFVANIVSAATETQCDLDIKKPTLVDALNELARQCDLQAIYPLDLVTKQNYFVLKGKYKLSEALVTLLQGTGLSGKVTTNGYITIKQSDTEIRGEQMISQKKGLLSLLAGIFFGGAALVSPSIQADNQTFSSSEIKPRQLEEIIITVQKRSESLQDIPIAVSAFSEGELLNFGVKNPQDLANVTTGMVYTKSGNISQPYLRGIGTRFSFVGLEPSIATYIDDRYISRPTAAMNEFNDIDRVEVIKGPQGTLYGRNAAGGAIRYVTKDVDDEFGGNVSVGLGNYEYRKLAGKVNIPMGDTFGVRFTALNVDREGFAHNLIPEGVPEWDDKNYKAYRSKLKWNMSDNLTSRLTIDYWEVNDLAGEDYIILEPVELNRGIVAGGITGKDLDEVASSNKQKNNGDEISVQLKLDYTMEKMDFVSISTYSDLEMNSDGSDADGTSLPLVDLLAVKELSEEYSQEFRLLSRNDSKFEWIVGAFYYTANGEVDSLISINNFIISQGHQVVDTLTYAIFGQTEFYFSDSWSILLGGRWSYEEKKLEFGEGRLEGLTVVPFPDDDDQNWREFTPKISIIHKFNDNANAYFTFARGFKSGGYNYPASTSMPLDPELLDMFELGFKASLFENKLKLNSALYYYDYTDLQVTRASGANSQLITDNAASAEILGLDLDMTLLVGDRVTILGGLNISDAKFQDWNDAAAKVFNRLPDGSPAPGMRDISFNASGKDMLRAPDWSAFASLKYTYAYDDIEIPITITYSYKDDYNFDFLADPLAQRLKQDGYGVLNTRISFIPLDGPWEVSFWANNLFDKKYFDNIVPTNNGIRGSFGEPRIYGLDVTFNF